MNSIVACELTTLTMSLAGNLFLSSRSIPVGNQAIPIYSVTANPSFLVVPTSSHAKTYCAVNNTALEFTEMSPLY